MINRLINPMVRSLAVRQRYVLQPSVRGYAYEGAPPPATMDDLPLPSGSWETEYKKNQSKYNMRLAVGVIFAGFTLIVAKASGLIYLNYYPPEKPAE